jgi:hypothetical protein
VTSSKITRLCKRRTKECNGFTEKAPTAMNQEAVELGTVQTPMLSLPALVLDTSCGTTGVAVYRERSGFRPPETFRPKGFPLPRAPDAKEGSRNHQPYARWGNLCNLHELVAEEGGFQLTKVAIVSLR